MGPFSDWSTPVWLGSAEKPAPDGSRVNSPFDDTHPGISPDGRSLYITSTRPGGPFPGENLWVSRRASLDAPLGLPEVIPPPLNNATGNTGAPNLTPDRHRMFFHHGRSPNFGGQRSFEAGRALSRCHPE